MASERIVAVGLLTQRDLNLLGPTFDRVWPVEEFQDQDAGFQDLLRAIDEAEQRVIPVDRDPARG